MVDGPHDEESEPLMSPFHDDSGGAGAKSPRTNVTRTGADSDSSSEPPARDQDAPGVNTTSYDENHPDDPVRPPPPAQLQVQDAVEVSSGTSTPRFVQDEGSWKRWRWVPYPVRRLVKSINTWTYGPAHPQPYRIKPLLPDVQRSPLWLLNRLLPRRKHQYWLLFLYCAAWLIGFVLLKRQESVAAAIKGWGPPQTIGCGVSYWSRDNGCGLDGSDCRPFNGSGFPFICSASCESYHVLNPRAVGDQEVIYRSMVIGGPNGDGDVFYRGDSYICGAAIHAGVISDQEGGCGVVELIGQQHNFKASNRNGIKSIGFNSYFPLSFRFVEGVRCSAKDMRWALLGLSATFTGVLSLFAAHSALFFFSNFIAIFWTVGMALDQPSASSPASLFSNILGKFLPAMFIAWVMYDKMGVRRTLGGLQAQVEKAILWLGPCWVGAMDNYTLSFIPIQRLTGHDLQQQPGAKAALAMIVLVLIVVVASQIWFFQREGRFRRYIKLYGLFVAALVIALLLPGLNLRIHHYILALLLLPGTSLQTRPSLIYQGLLVGLFINGIARWGFDAVLQTPAALQGDAQKGTILPTIPEPTINWSNATNGVSNITFTWEQPKVQVWDGISILVNDVERFRSYFEDKDRDESFLWSRNSSLDLPEYFRFAFIAGSEPGDYTKAGRWTADGDWVKMKKGPSRLRARNFGGEENLRKRK